MRERTKERLESFWKGPTIDRVIALGGMVGLAAFAWLFGEVVRMATDYPAPLAAVCAVSFLLGVLLAYLLGIRDERLERRRERRKAEAEAERLEAERQAEAERRDARLCAYVRRMDFHAKLFLLAVAEKGPRLLEGIWVDAPDLARTVADLKRCPLLVAETAAGGTLLHLSDEGRGLLDRHPELLEVAREHVAGGRRGD